LNSDRGIIMAKIGVGIIKAKMRGVGGRGIIRLKSDLGVGYYIG